MTDIEIKQLKRKLEKQRKINRKKSALIAELKKFVSKKAFDIALERAISKKGL